MGIRDLYDLNNAVNPMELIPAKTKLKFVVSNLERGPTQSGGMMVKLEAKVIKSEMYEGKMVRFNFNLENANPRAEQIGRAQFDNFLDACGIYDYEEEHEMIGAEFIATVGIQEGQNGYNDSNTFSSFQRLTQKKAQKTAAKTPASAATPIAQAQDANRGNAY